MFVLRGIAVSLTSFVLLYGLLSVLIVSLWRGVGLMRVASAAGQANLLFRLRLFPLVASASVTLALVVPAYVRLEPRSIEEGIAVPLACGLGCVLLFALGLFRVAVAETRAARVVADWLNGANALNAGVPAPTFQTTRRTPPLMLVGVFSPKVVVSEATVALLSRDELLVAAQHEVVHMRSRDNLKKLTFYCAPFPGMSGLERAWQDAAELAADDGAVSSVSEALDLATALIKLSRLIPVRETPAFTMALLSGPGSVSARVERLLAWDASRCHQVQTRWHYAFPSILATILCAAALYQPVLAQTHRVTEWLVR